jgi:GTP-binding protein YchF
MSTSIGIVGLPNVGKSTLFNALTKNNILAANYPFATIEPNTGIVPVPDERLIKLSELHKNAPIVNSTVTFVDIAGLVKGASKGEGLGNQFLANIRECDAILHLVRAFETSDVVHVEDRIHPEEDIQTIETELALADLQTIENSLPRIRKLAKSDPKTRPDLEKLEQAKSILDQGKLLSSDKELASEEVIRNLQLITAKPVIYAFNVDETDMDNVEKLDALRKLASPAEAVFINAKFEHGLNDMEEEDAKEFLDLAGLKESGLEQVIKSAFNILGLQSYLTAGDKEVRSWTIKKGSTAPEAAGVIHGDFQRGFIAADIANYSALVDAGSWANAKTQGKVRTEGKTYVMQTDDVVEFKFNV